MIIIGLFYWLEEGGGDVGCGYSDEVFYDDGYALLTFVACYVTNDAGEGALGDTDFLTLMEMCVVLRNFCDVAIVDGTEEAQAIHLALGNNEGLANQFVVYSLGGIIEAKEGKVGIVIDEGLYLW